MEPRPTHPKVHALHEKVPDELVNQLHEANAHFHSAKERLEEAMDDSGFGHQSRIEAGTDRVRDAEREVEEVTERIHRETGWPAAAGDQRRSNQE